MGQLVIIVEDSQLEAPALEIALASIPGVTVRHALTGRAALDILESADGQSVRAILTDLDMPKMSGFELIRHVRANPRLTRLPIIVLSGDADPKTPGRTLELGADAFFAKPYSPVAVRKKLEELLDARPQ
jgi:CheY-like chemotaxis protein